jgi:N-acyl-D-aspartate/D-glutamate deacylase
MLHIKVGADTDISVFDPARVIDKATYENSGQYSEDFQYVMIGSTFAVLDGKLREDVAPGEAIRAR